jgi:hypothetical protein
MLDRRDWLSAGLAIAAASFASPISWAADPPSSRRLKVAAIFMEFTYRSHAHVILENFLEPYLFNGRPIQPEFDIVSFYGDQFPDGEIGRDVAKEYGIPIFATIAEALTLDSDQLAVDAVLSIGEHGHYPVNEKGTDGISAQAVLRRDRGRHPAVGQARAHLQRQASVLSLGLGQSDVRHGSPFTDSLDGGQFRAAGRTTADV